MNNPSIKIGEELDRLKSFTVGMDPKDKGMVIGNSDLI
jgi:hypothetical protein